MTEKDLYKELGILTKERDRWEESIPYVSSLLTHESVQIRAKALWLLGEMGLLYPLSVQDSVPAIASFTGSPVALLRERAVGALGRIGRSSYAVIEPYDNIDKVTDVAVVTDFDGQGEILKRESAE